jgi:hypothetical protein
MKCNYCESSLIEEGGVVVVSCSLVAQLVVVAIRRPVPVVVVPVAICIVIRGAVFLLLNQGVLAGTGTYSVYLKHKSSDTQTQFDGKKHTP